MRPERRSMNDRTSKLLLDAYHACGDATSFVDGVTLEQYNRSLLVRSGVERQILIIAEAISKADKLDPGLESRLPEYKRLRGMRNRIVHDYERTDNKVVWMTAKRHLPILRDRLAVLLTEAGWGHALDAET